MRYSSLLYSSNTVAVANNEESYYIGVSYARKFKNPSGPQVLFGSSLFVTYTSWARAYSFYRLTSVSPATDFRIGSANIYIDGSSLDAVAVGGVQLAWDKLRIGLVAHSPSISLSGEYEQTTLSNDFANGEFAGDGHRDSSFVRQTEGVYEERQPVRFGLGLAYETKSWTIATDVTVLVPMGEYKRFVGESETSTLQEGLRPEITDETVITRQDERMTVDVSAGLEYKFNDLYALRIGGFTSFSSVDPDSIENFASESIDRFGGTIGLGVDLGGVETSVTFAYVGGIGKVVGFDSYNSANTEGLRRTEFLQSSFVLLVSGAVDINSILRKGS